MAAITKRATPNIIVVAALFCYFYSESMLRQAAVIGVKRDNVQIEGIADKLPGFLRDRIMYRVEMGRVQDMLRTAASNRERVLALNMLAFHTRDDRQREEAYAEIVKKYPGLPESTTAFAYFLMAQNTPVSVSTAEFQDFIERCPPENRPSAWHIGLGKLNERKFSQEARLDFLMPLLDRKPEFRDYQRLYADIADMASAMRMFDVADRAKNLQVDCAELPTIESVLMEREGREK